MCDRAVFCLVTATTERHVRQLSISTWNKPCGWIFTSDYTGQLEGDKSNRSSNRHILINYIVRR